jgi:hypothetical protein
MYNPNMYGLGQSFGKSSNPGMSAGQIWQLYQMMQGLGGSSDGSHTTGSLDEAPAKYQDYSGASDEALAGGGYTAGTGAGYGGQKGIDGGQLAQTGMMWALGY